ncbi:MAG: sigma 54-interacting transcriptional regulator, partial [Candidatus Eiseniibacteriota bacterium]
LYLDEVAAAPQAVQIRLLPLLQERAFERVGGRTAIPVDVRLIAGTARDIGGLAREGRFREDLLRRLAAARIAMPPLRERREDIPPMVERFLREANRRHRRRVKGVTRGVLEILQRHAWPGNVRELRDTVESMVVSAPGGRPLDLADLPRPLRAGADARERVEIAPGMTVEEAERALIAATLAHVGHDKPRAAAMLGIGLRTLYRKIKEYGAKS